MDGGLQISKKKKKNILGKTAMNFAMEMKISKNHKREIGKLRRIVQVSFSMAKNK
jgi:hypothetical protein